MSTLSQGAAPVPELPSPAENNKITGKGKDSHFQVLLEMPKKRGSSSRDVGLKQTSMRQFFGPSQRATSSSCASAVPPQSEPSQEESSSSASSSAPTSSTDGALPSWFNAVAELVARVPGRVDVFPFWHSFVEQVLLSGSAVPSAVLDALRQPLLDYVKAISDGYVYCKTHQSLKVLTLQSKLGGDFRDAEGKLKSLLKKLPVPVKSGTFCTAKTIFRRIQMSTGCTDFVEDADEGTDNSEGNVSRRGERTGKTVEKEARTSLHAASVAVAQRENVREVFVDIDKKWIFEDEDLKTRSVLVCTFSADDEAIIRTILPVTSGLEFRGYRVLPVFSSLYKSRFTRVDSARKGELARLQVEKDAVTFHCVKETTEFKALSTDKRHSALEMFRVIFEVVAKFRTEDANLDRVPRKEYRETISHRPERLPALRTEQGALLAKAFGEYLKENPGEVVRAGGSTQATERVLLKDALLSEKFQSLESEQRIPLENMYKWMFPIVAEAMDDRHQSADDACLEPLLATSLEKAFFRHVHGSAVRFCPRVLPNWYTLKRDSNWSIHDSGCPPVVSLTIGEINDIGSVCLSAYDLASAVIDSDSDECAKVAAAVSVSSFRILSFVQNVIDGKFEEIRKMQMTEHLLKQASKYFQDVTDKVNPVSVRCVNCEEQFKILLRIPGGSQLKEKISELTELFLKVNVQVTCSSDVCGGRLVDTASGGDDVWITETNQKTGSYGSLVRANRGVTDLHNLLYEPNVHTIGPTKRLTARIANHMTINPDGHSCRCTVLRYNPIADLAELQVPDVDRRIKGLKSIVQVWIASQLELNCFIEQEAASDGSATPMERYFMLSGAKSGLTLGHYENFSRASEQEWKKDQPRNMSVWNCVGHNIDRLQFVSLSGKGLSHHDSNEQRKRFEQYLEAGSVINTSLFNDHGDSGAPIFVVFGMAQQRRAVIYGYSKANWTPPTEAIVCYATPAYHLNNNSEWKEIGKEPVFLEETEETQTT